MDFKNPAWQLSHNGLHCFATPLQFLFAFCVLIFAIQFALKGSSYLFWFLSSKTSLLLELIVLIYVTYLKGKRQKQRSLICWLTRQVPTTVVVTLGRTIILTILILPKDKDIFHVICVFNFIHECFLISSFYIFHLFG